MRKKIFLPGILLFLSACTYDKEAIEMKTYPDCFAELDPSPYIPYTSCGSMLALVQLDATRMLEISVRANELAPTQTCSSYEIAAYPLDIHIYYHTYTNDPDSIYFPICTDIAYPDTMLGHTIKWKATSGTLTFAVSGEYQQYNSCEPYKVCYRLQNVIFEKENSTEDTLIPDFVIKDIVVGRCII